MGGYRIGADLNWDMGAASVAGTRARDADVTLRWHVLQAAFDLVLFIDGRRDMYMQLLLQQPHYFDFFM